MDGVGKVEERLELRGDGLYHLVSGEWLFEERGDTFVWSAEIMD